MDEQNPGSRIVSRREYVCKQMERALTASMGGCFGLLATFCAILALSLIIGAILVILCSSAGIVGSIVILFLSLVGAMFPGIIAVVMFCYSSILFKEARMLDPGIPFTQVNTANLPAEETLVRASVEPIQQQQAVLLRGAIHSDTTPAEQLVRPAAGKSE